MNNEPRVTEKPAGTPAVPKASAEILLKLANVPNNRANRRAMAKLVRQGGVR